MAEHWSASHYAREAGVSRETAQDVLNELAIKYMQDSKSVAMAPLNHLANVARKARDADLRLMERHAKLVEKAIRQLELSDDLSIGDLAKLTALRQQHNKLVESLTGLDVAKQVAVRREAMRDGEVSAWDGVEALESSSLEIMATVIEPDRMAEIW
jgi:hypothetical protein